MRDDIAKSVLYAKKLLDTYNQHEIADEKIDLHLVFHGKSINALVNDTTRERLKAAGGAENPNRAIIAELLKRGVHIELCGSTMEQHDVISKDLIEGVSIVPGAYPRLIELQMLGYSYIKFE